MSASTHAAAWLTIDLGAVARNYAILRARLAGAECAAVVKANAYGLGAARVAPALRAAGCMSFFVAGVDEGIELRRAVPDGRIFVLNGALAGTLEDLGAHGLIPVLNDLEQVERWAGLGAHSGRPAAAIQLDTGMNRLGLPAYEVAALAARPELLAALDLRLVMSHLACAEESGNPMNEAQRRAFESLRARLPAAPASLANSSGIFLGPAYHFDLVRPGAALYGINPCPGSPNPMQETVRLRSRVIQLRRAGRGETVGYGATHRFEAEAVVATVPVGYADGYLRALGNGAEVAVAGVRAPVVGRVSMDLITVDVSAVPRHALHVGAEVELIGGPCPVDAVAERAGTIGYEILTGLGQRYRRHYIAPDSVEAGREDCEHPRLGRAADRRSGRA